ncbi:SDR family oxidoreductase [Parapedobacter sp. ISTM3]|uniref:NADP-dependent 3-hydroxy acid dehydrogenase YdfG n=1 Tax=Parapedobacter luteus TaxID=623280 RepID=A0A1T5DBS5_9SPHI|nr:MULTISPECIES: SDR family oxidoreductase [Parapedobacter]MBK1438474.1 SDR family oxidoreductase [Parapedobacter sp. ISTM3]SKB68973.1 NADP-dependent 3-hydroxy acid dehydrogenase YdfG [Parapedobacter luteus]
MEAVKAIYEDKLIQPVKGKRILITGGTTGIGRATAHLLARENQVMIVGRHEQELEDALSDFRQPTQSRGGLAGEVGDLVNPQDIERLFSRVDEEFGQLDVLINNAGLAFNSILEGSYDDWAYILNTNLLGYLACSRQAIDRMRARGEGHIVNIGSMSADVREKDSSVYVATKSGIQGFSESLRKEVNDLGIKVTLIEPGAVGTDMQPREGQEEQIEKLEMLKAEDIAVAIYYCLSTPKRCDVVEMQIRPHQQQI